MLNRFITVSSLVLLLLAPMGDGVRAADTVGGMADNAYYTVHPMFHPFPDETLATQVIGRFGPVGIGIELRDDGRTDSDRYAWSGGTLMDVGGNQALEMTAKRVGDTDYLFIQAGEFSKPGRNGTWVPDHPADWSPALYVMKRQ